MLFFGFYGQMAVAQTGVDSSGGETKQLTTIADINFRDSIILNQEENVLDIYFRLENNYSQSESGIRYGVQLVKDKKLFDEKVYTEDILSIEGNKSVKKVFNYIAPTYLSGEYELWLVAKNESGLPLATFKMEKPVTFKGDGEYLEIDQNSCALKIDGEAEDKKYGLSQGVSLKAEENLKLSCDAISRFKEFTIVAPIFNTYERTLFGNLVDKNRKGTEVSFQMGEKKTIEFTIEKPTISQAYEARLDLMRTSGDLSSAAVPIIFHYVIAGESATIQKLDLDKIAYQKGDAIGATLLWSGSADNFEGSRIGVAENGPVVLSLNISNQSGQECANALEQKLEPNGEAKLALVAKANCADPKVRVVLKNEQGIVLAQKEFNFLKDKEIVPQKPQTGQKTLSIFLFCELVALVVLFFFRKRSIKPANVLPLLVLVLFGLSFGKAEALTLSNTFYNNWTNVVLNINLNKSVYEPGEQVTTTTTGYAQIVDCANHDNNGVSLSGGTGSCYKNPIFSYGQSVLGGGYVGVNVSDSTCSASTTPGTQRYSFNFSLIGEGANRDSGSGDIYYTVADNTPEPTCNISFGSGTYNVGDWGPLTWSNTNATGASLYCANGNNVIMNSPVYPATAGSYSNNVFGVQLTSAGSAYCVLTVTNGAKSNTCHTPSIAVVVPAPTPTPTPTPTPEPELKGKIWFVGNKLVYKVGQSGIVQWETENATTANLHCWGTPNDSPPIDTIGPVDVPVKGTHRMQFNRAGFVLCELVISNGVEESNLEISSNAISDSLAYFGRGKTAFAASGTVRAIALSVTVQVAECVNTCSGSCVITNPNNGMIPTAGECCNAATACYACPPNTTWDGNTCASPAPIPIASGNASFNPSSLTAPGTSKLSWNSTNADEVWTSCTGPLPIPYGNYGLSYNTAGGFDFPFAANQTGVETCTFKPYKNGVLGTIFSASVVVGGPTCSGWTLSLLANPASGSVPLTSILTAQTNQSFGGETYLYSNQSCGSGGWPVINGEKFTCVYPTAGTYQPSVRVTAQSTGCINDASTMVTVNSGSCSPDCSCASSTCVNETCSNGCLGTCAGTKTDGACCVPDNASCVVNICEDQTCYDGCRNVTGTKSKICTTTCNAGDCGTKAGEGTCGAACPNLYCGPCNSGNWQEVAPE